MRNLQARKQLANKSENFKRSFPDLPVVVFLVHAGACLWFLCGGKQLPFIAFVSQLSFPHEA